MRAATSRVPGRRVTPNATEPQNNATVVLSEDGTASKELASANTRARRRGHASESAVVAIVTAPMNANESAGDLVTVPQIVREKDHAKVVNANANVIGRVKTATGNELEENLARNATAHASVNEIASASASAKKNGSAMLVGMMPAHAIPRTVATGRHAVLVAGAVTVAEEVVVVVAAAAAVEVVVVEAEIVAGNLVWTDLWLNGWDSETVASASADSYIVPGTDFHLVLVITNVAIANTRSRLALSVCIIVF